MFITDDGIRLSAELDMPERHGEKCPLVIVIHGFTGYKEERHIVAVSRALNRIGFATLRVDMYGHGHSDGEFSRHTLFKWLSNALTVIDYARGLDFVKEIYLCGHSQGGLLVMLAAAMRRELIRGQFSHVLRRPDRRKKIRFFFFHIELFISFSQAARG